MSSKLSVSIHLLTILALYKGQPLTSEILAESANTNPVVIRRLLGLLRAGGFVDSKTGVGGGWVIVAEPEDVTFLDVLRAVEPHDEIFALHRSGPSQECPVGRSICGVLTEMYSEFKQGMAKQLSCSTLACVVGKVRNYGECGAGSPQGSGSPSSAESGSGKSSPI